LAAEPPLLINKSKFKFDLQRGVAGIQYGSMILVAPTAFKGTLSAGAVAEAAARGARCSQNLDVLQLPVSDGGPGLIDALLYARGGSAHVVTVAGPLGEPTRARVLVQKPAAVVESADACGLHLIDSEQRDPMQTSTFGVGELILRAAEYSDQVSVGVGGSATIDCGLGMAEAFGFGLLDDNDKPVGRGGRGVLELARIERSATPLPRITVLTDVRNPLFGGNGAAHVFGPQKGAAPDVIERLDAGMQRVAEIMQRDLGVDVASTIGGGAGGGLAAGLLAFAVGTLTSGSKWVLEQVDFDRALARATVVVTGEGAYDAQSSMGKITGEIIERARQHGVRVLLVAGSVTGELPPHVVAVSEDKQLTSQDIERLVSAALPRLLSQ
jgi:glycerate kinase